MEKISIRLGRWLRRWAEREAAPGPLDGLTPCQLADLPPHHPGPAAGCGPVSGA